MRQASPIYYPALMGFRFVIASLVFMGHNPSMLVDGIPEQLRLSLLEIHGSAIFFCLSGFLITCSYLSRPFTSARDYFVFWFTRLARIYPLYLAMLLVLHCQWLFFIPELLLHLTLLKGYFASFSLNGIAQAWSLTAELTFYLLAPGIYWYIRRQSLHGAYAWTLAAGLALTLMGYLLARAGWNAYGFMADLKFSVMLTFFGRATDFFAGIWLAFHLQHRSRRPGRWRRLPVSYTFAGIAAFGVVLWGVSLFRQGEEPGFTSWYGLLLYNLLVPLASVWTIYGLIHEKTWLQRLLSTRLLMRLGYASYAFFLLHLGWVRNWFILHLTENILFHYLLMWSLAVGVYLTFEKPVYQWLKSRISGLRT
jgi:peptidoglycan/LPS O-acetylase OafA/YrhL